MKSRKLHDIIFSERPSWRWKRHVIFWLAVFVYHIVRIGIMLPAVNTVHLWLGLLEMSFTWGVLPNMLSVYFIIYYLIPKYFIRKKYISFIAGILVLILVLLSYTFYRNFYNLNASVRQAIGLSTGMLMNTFRPGFIRMFGNPPLITGLFLSLKILKNWHLEELKTETLAKENTNAELQLLKAQVHPHFLFNTLNNIYSFTLTESPQAAALVQKLSDLLNYMINECEQSLVPLEREIKLFQDYIGLEKVRYGNRLDLQVEITGDYKNKLIAPLLMIPFIENCFKHGASIMRGEQWIRLLVNIKDDQLYFNLSNSKPPQPPEATDVGGIGLANVRKRLALLYDGKHFLKTESVTDAYIVHLQVSLQQLPVTEQSYMLAPMLQPV